MDSPRYAAEFGPPPDEVVARFLALEADGKTVVVVLLAKRLVGLIALRDEPREDTAPGVTRLKTLGIRAATGDNRRTGNAIASALGLEAQAELLPDANSPPSPS